MTADPNVLIVDDETGVVETYREALSQRYAVQTATAGSEALEKLDDAVDVVLLDRRMPGMTGDEVLGEIRDRGVDCRVVMVTAVEPDTDIIAMDFDEYLVKPVTNEQLMEVVERMLNRKNLDRQIQRIIRTGSRLATLEAKLDYHQLQESEEYAALREEFYDLRDGANLEAAQEDPYLEAAVENIEALLRDTR